MHNTPLPSESFDTVVADLPFGMVKGTDANLDELYTGALAEAARLAAPGGAFVVITARRRLFEDTLERFTNRWERTAEVPLSVSFRRGYIKPSVYLLRRV
jgi:tRNA G10  N-methylase Trm11